MENAELFAQLAVDEIVEDLSDRRGLRQQWDQIDDDIKEGIKATWKMIILDAMIK